MRDFVLRRSRSGPFFSPPRFIQNQNPPGQSLTLPVPHNLFGTDHLRSHDDFDVVHEKAANSPAAEKAGGGRPINKEKIQDVIKKTTIIPFPWQRCDSNRMHARLQLLYIHFVRGLWFEQNRTSNKNNVYHLKLTL